MIVSINKIRIEKYFSNLILFNTLHFKLMTWCTRAEDTSFECASVAQNNLTVTVYHKIKSTYLTSKTTTSFLLSLAIISSLVIKLNLRRLVVDNWRLSKLTIILNKVELKWRNDRPRWKYNWMQKYNSLERKLFIFQCKLFLYRPKLC